MKTLQEIKDEVAQKEGHADWKHVQSLDGEAAFVDKIAKAYGEMLLREAAERAKTKPVYPSDTHGYIVIVDNEAELETAKSGQKQG